MKMKTDFVTNSSSSTFVVIFENKVTCLEDISKYILQDQKAKQVFRDAKRQRPKKISLKVSDFLSEQLSYGYADHLVGIGYSEYQEEFCNREGITSQELYANRAWQQIFYKEYESITARACKQKAVEFLEQHEGRYMYIFNYGDEDGTFMSEMEHGGTFNSLPHITISKH